MYHELKKVNKPKGPSEDTSVPLGREKNAIMGAFSIGKRSGSTQELFGR